MWQGLFQAVGFAGSGGAKEYYSVFDSAADQYSAVPLKVLSGWTTQYFDQYQLNVRSMHIPMV